MKKNIIPRIEPKNKMYIVVCGGNEIRNESHLPGHAAVCFDIDVAMAEKKQMEECGYPCKGIFEITTLNIFHEIPYYLEEKLKK